MLLICIIRYAHYFRDLNHGVRRDQQGQIEHMEKTLRNCNIENVHTAASSQYSTRGDYVGSLVCTHHVAGRKAGDTFDGVGCAGRKHHSAPSNSTSGAHLPRLLACWRENIDPKRLYWNGTKVCGGGVVFVMFTTFIFHRPRYSSTSLVDH